jgi:anaerobic dimethyl sulfoxide reductase subunit A
MDSTITPSGIWADVLLPIATHFERHDVALPWYKGHYYIHRPKVIEPWASRSPTSRSSPNWPTGWASDPATTRKPRASTSTSPDAVDEAYLVDWWDKVIPHQGVTMSWEDLQEARHLQVHPAGAPCGLPQADREGRSLRDRLGQDRDPLDQLAQITDWTRTQYGYARFPTSPSGSNPWESLNSEKTKEHSLPSGLAAPALAHAFDLQQHPLAARDLQQEVTLNAGDAKRLGVVTGDTVEVWNDRGRCVVPVYVTERCMPGVAVCTKAPGWTWT